MRALAALALAAASLIGCSASTSGSDDPLHHWRERGFASKTGCYEHHKRISGQDMTAEQLRWWCGE